MSTNNVTENIDSQSTWHLANTDGKYHSNPLCSVNTFVIGGSPPPEKIKLELTEGDENEGVREWEKYVETKLNDPFWRNSEKYMLILAQLTLIQKRDKKNNTNNFERIINIHNIFIDRLLSVVNDSNVVSKLKLD